VCASRYGAHVYVSTMFMFPATSILVFKLLQDLYTYTNMRVVLVFGVSKHSVVGGADDAVAPF